MMKKILKTLGVLVFILGLSIIGFLLNRSYIQGIVRQNVGGMVSVSQENLGFSASTTMTTLSFSTSSSYLPALVSPQRTTRYYGAFFNNGTSTVYLYLGPTSTPISLGSPTTTQSAFPGVGIPVVANGSYELSQGKGNLYFGPVSVPTSTNNQSWAWIEKFNP